jgi:hypothetical protein
MSTYHKVGLAAAIACACLASAISSASAGRLNFSERRIAVTWSNPPGEEMRFSAETFAIECAVALRASLSANVVAKTAGAQIGEVRGIAAAGCAGGTVITLNGVEGPATLPWPIRYDSFSGTLPAITGIRVRIVNAGFLATFGVNNENRCLYRSTEAEPLYVIMERNVTSGVVTAWRVDETRPIRLETTLAGTCPARMTIRGRTPEVTADPEINVTLI